MPFFDGLPSKKGIKIFSPHLDQHPVLVQVRVYPGKLRIYPGLPGVGGG